MRTLIRSASRLSISGLILALPLALGGHPGEAGAAPTAASHPA